MFQIKLLNDFDYSEISKNIYSTIYVIANDIAFPDEQWADLPISVLTMWNESIKQNYYKKRGEFSLFFMDGPFFIECCKEENDVIMKFIDNRKDPIEKYKLQMPFTDLINSVINGTAQLISLIDQSNLGSLRSLEELRESANNLKHLVNC